MDQFLLFFLIDHPCPSKAIANTYGGKEGMHHSICQKHRKECFRGVGIEPHKKKVVNQGFQEGASHENYKDANNKLFHVAFVGISWNQKKGDAVKNKSIKYCTDGQGEKQGVVEPVKRPDGTNEEHGQNI